MIVNADSRDYLAQMIEEGRFVDSIVTDPPYGLTSVVKRFGKEGSAPAKSAGATGVYARASAGFMGQKWDGTGIEQDPEFWRLCYGVLKPGGYLLAFGGTRTWHRIAVAIEDAGFEKRDTIMWLYGTGFPKSHDVSKGIDREVGAVRTTEVEPRRNTYDGATRDPSKHGNPAAQSSFGAWGLTKTPHGLPAFAPATAEAVQWQGWGTALKPAWEPIMVFRKPLEGTVAANVLAHGTGAMNIDGCRTGVESRTYKPKGTSANAAMIRVPEHRNGKAGDEVTVSGRWPANVMHDGSPEVTSMFPLSNGQMGKARTDGEEYASVALGKKAARANNPEPRGDTGSAARFFYGAKATKNDRNTDATGRIVCENMHPTVKPHGLMQWLVRLVTPPGGTVLDPFAGSGSTGKACRLEGFQHIGIEADPAFASIAALRSGSDFQGSMRRLAAAIERFEEALHAQD